MRVLIVKNAAELGKTAAAVIAREIRRKPRLVLGLDVSNTLLGAYRGLADMHRKENLDFSRVISFNLDEYVGLGADHSYSCRNFMNEHFFNHVNMDNRNINIPNGLTKDLNQMCAEYEWAVKDVAGIDLQVLAIGKDGHLGFNEPGSSLTSRTRIKTLTEKTVREIGGSFKKKSEVPRFAITMGIGTIMESRRCIMLASGKRKASVLVKAIEGPLTTSVPASMLQMHPNVTVIADREAAANLKQKSYYNYVEKMALQIEEAQI